MKSIYSLLAAWIFLGFNPCHAETLSGKIYEKGSNPPKLLFQFKMTEETKGKTHRIKGIYSYPDGKPAVEDEVVLENGKIEKYLLTQHQTQETAIMEKKDGKLHFALTTNGITKTDEEDAAENLTMGNTLIPYLSARWKALLDGDSLKVRYAVLERKETVGFKFFKDDEEKLNGRDVIKVKMKPTSFFISAIVKPLILVFDKETKRLIEHHGRVLPKKQEGSDWKDLDADVIYQYP